ncbi:TM2 domain-containing protein [Marinilongibacter aquaticus]|uniref:TM2 domain-containing protein n=1 Tax=Marinilongibacter aquaticus TaxID=2975157 RepID=UPI0021BD59A6|nr:TM2 domain-containing protein [Marinilongibacter aquaticus]UBM58213.1 TM2 domain-containing protein [Marinilongibacter aquaticus]
MKEKSTAGILGILLGGLGVHKFYLGKTGQGIIYLLFCWSFIPAIIGLIEGISYLTQSEEEFNRKWNGIKVKIESPEEKASREKRLAELESKKAEEVTKMENLISENKDRLKKELANGTLTKAAFDAEYKMWIKREMDLDKEN